MTTPDNDSARSRLDDALREKVPGALSEIESLEDSQARELSPGEVPPGEVPPGEVFGLSPSELDALKNAGEALMFLDQVRTDLKQIGNSDVSLKGTSEAHISTATNFATLDQSVVGNELEDLIGSFDPKGEVVENEGDITFARFQVKKTLGQGGFARLSGLRSQPRPQRRVENPQATMPGIRRIKNSI